MLTTISEKSKAAFENAAKKLGLSNELPNFSNLREDLVLWLTAKYMLAVIIEADKDGKIFDITNHSKRKYEPFHYAEEGYKAGSSGGGFSCSGYVGAVVYSAVGARLSFNSSGECKANTGEYSDLWEIVTLDVR